MTLQAKLTTLEGLDETLASQYKQDGESFVLDVAAVDGLELRNTSGLTSALQKERENARSAQARLEKYGDLDPNGVRDALEKLEDMKDWKPQGKVDERVKALETQLAKRHANELGGRDKTITALQHQLTDTLVEGTARSELAKYTKRVELLLPHVVRQVRAEYADNRVSAHAVDEHGTPRLTMRADSTDKMQIPELVETMRAIPEYAFAFEGSNAAGIGTTDVGGGAGSPVQWNDMESLSSNIDDIASGKVRVIK
jgi:hypothetical protein